MSADQPLCPALVILASGESLICHHETAPHPGVMHYDRVRGKWWGETDEPGQVSILDDTWPG